MQQELRLNLARVAEDHIRLRLEKIFDATDRHVRRLCGTPHHPVSRAEPLDQRLTDRGLSSPEEAEGAEDLLLKCLDGIDEGLNGAPDKWDPRRERA